MNHSIDIDVGGTFTDCFATADGTWVSAKVPTTHHDLSVCFSNALEAIAGQLGRPVEDMLADTGVLRYSTTIGINALIERTGPKLGLITTRGFEDTIYVGRSRQWGDGLPLEQVRDLATIRKPEPLIPRELVAGVSERVDSSGRVLMPLDPDDVREQVQTLVDRGATGFVVALLWSFANPEHELAVQEVIREEYPDTYLGNFPVICSHQVSPRVGEYARTMTAVVDAYTHAALSDQLFRIGEMCRKRGYQRPLMLVHNSGGSKKLTRTRAIDTHAAGPAAGVFGTATVARLYGLDDMLFTDVGGTSFDIAVVSGRAISSYDFRPIFDRWRVQGSFVETKSIGAGGGSIAWIDEALGRLHVGPRSAGSMPGPVAYDQGGEEPTVTDADLVLGMLDPDYYLGGRFPLDVDSAREAITERIAKPLGVDTDEAAWRIHHLANAVMGQEIFTEVALKGHDPKDFTIVAAGGAGPVHACGYADFVGARRVLALPFSSVFCAFGSSGMDVMHIYERTRRLALTRFMRPDAAADLDAFNEVVDELRAEAERDFALEGFTPDQLHLELEVDMRFGTQLNSTRVKAPKPHLSSQEDVAELCAAFVDEFGRQFSPEAAFPQAGIDIQELHLKAWVPATPAALPESALDGPGATPALTGHRPVHWGPGHGTVETPVYRHERLRPGNRFDGPAIVEASDTTIVVPPGWDLTLDAYGTCVLERTTGEEVRP
ncbi:hydantoinase/oxoprolinase family protein [Amycolatopsis rhizosphaerae]|uniref:Hydantoinase/oxoprolinase family protein n=1 Tax=Amycolatopsis rhizosphaerae TaxID=2053003 RepID=A0A558DCX9_9PSEU|nr:hydantoinase/oxoprolinase family protein [Amycolatopsis rhizosphaerae]TVT58881.1 hydantoinase/oxoprolinase family protein [Amycolatopsis rhizosphaerae]